MLTAVGSTFATSYTLQYIAARSRLTPPDTTTPPTKATPPPGTTNTLSLTVPLYTYRGHQGTVAALSWSPNGRWIASSGVLDKTVQVWEATTGNHVLTYRLHPAAVNTVAWSPDGQYIASAGQDGIVQVWPPQAIQAGQEDEIGSHPAPLSIVRYAGHGGAAVNNLAFLIVPILPLLARISPYSSGTASRHAISSPIHNIAKEGPREVCKV